MRTSWVEIDLAALDENIVAVRKALNPGTELIFVVKADAYGHGAAPLAQRAWHQGVRWFAVAYLHEALALRYALSEPDILVMGVAGPEDVADLVRNRITPIVVSVEQGVALGDAAVALGKRLRVHVKIDTGMGRLGLPWQEAVGMYRELWLHDGLEITGVCSHFAAVEPADDAAAIRQAERFDAFEAERRAFDHRDLMRHLSSSRAMLYYGKWDFNAVRPGIALYGYGALDPDMRARTRPLLEWKTRVAQVRSVPADTGVGYYSTYRTEAPTTLATLCVGYADGFLRTLSNRGLVLIRGRRCRVVGRVSMNWVTVDAGPDSDVAAGDEAVLIGRQDGEEIWAGELARLCRTIPYEILTNISPLTERRYIG